MPAITFIHVDGKFDRVETSGDESAMQAATRHGLDGARARQVALVARSRRSVCEVAQARTHGDDAGAIVHESRCDCATRVAAGSRNQDEASQAALPVMPAVDSITSPIFLASAS